jgi:hypothetical protein
MLTRMNSKAYAILGIIANELSDKEFKNLVVEPYLNGRECGFSVYFALRSVDVKLIFSEYRRSDNIVVYKGKVYDFGTSNSLTEETYKNSLTFESYGYYDAAMYIVNQLRGE